MIGLWSSASQNRIGNHASNMLGDLTRLREKSNTVGLWPHGHVCAKGVDVINPGKAEDHLRRTQSWWLGYAELPVSIQEPS